MVLSRIHGATTVEFQQRLIDELTPVRGGLAEVADVLDRGRAKHPNGDGFRQTARFHIERAQQHLRALSINPYRTGDDHLAHAATRLLMALQSRKEGRW
jgi:hypothetical protein